MGVVILFSQYATKFGYVISDVQAGFPDVTLQSLETGEKVTAEFEYKARNFKYHKHDPDGCDFIICWENDWPDCPLRVVELKLVHDISDDEIIAEIAREFNRAVRPLEKGFKTGKHLKCRACGEPLGQVSRVKGKSAVAFGGAIIREGDIPCPSCGSIRRFVSCKRI